MLHNRSRSSSESKLPRYPTYWNDETPPYFNHVPTVIRQTFHISRTSNRTRTSIRPLWCLRHEKNPYVNTLVRRMDVHPDVHSEILAQIMLCKYHFNDVDPAQLSAFFARDLGITLWASQIRLISERIDWLQQDVWPEWKSLLMNAEDNFMAMTKEDCHDLRKAWKVDIVDRSQFRGWEVDDPTKAWEEVASETAERSRINGKRKDSVRNWERDPEERMQSIEEDVPVTDDAPMKNSFRGEPEVIDMTGEMADMEVMMADNLGGDREVVEEHRAINEDVYNVEYETAFVLEEV